MNSQEILIAFKNKFKKEGLFKDGSFKKTLLKYNLELLKQGKTETYLVKNKYYNPITQRIRTHKLDKRLKQPKPTKSSLNIEKKLKKEADFDYISSNGDLVKIPESVKKNPIPYLEQKFNTKIYTLSQLKKKNFKLLKNIPSKKKIKLLLKIEFELWYNGDFFSKLVKFNTEVVSNAEELSDEAYIIELINEYWGSDIEESFEVKNIKKTIFSKKSGQELQLKDMKLFQSNPLKINNLYNEVIDKNYKDCVYDYLIDIWGKKLSNKQKILLQDKRTVEELLEYCKKYNIKLLAYDINGNIISSYYPPIKQKKFKNLVFIAYNQHLYPLKNNTLHKVCIDDKDLIYKNIDNAHKKFILFMKNGELPKIIRIDNDGLVMSFIHEKTLYFQNQDYIECQKILENMGIKDRLKWNINFKNICSIIEPIYCNGENLDSFWLNSKDFTKSGFRYCINDENYNELLNEEYITADKNKAYSHAFINLKFLISVDFKTNKLEKYTDDLEIVPHYIYVVKVDKSNILFENTNVYTGEHILKCITKGLIKGKDFIIKEFIETKKHFNYLRQMILDLYEKVDKKIAKKIVNIYIGKMERSSTFFESLKPNKIMDKEEFKSYKGSYKELGLINNIKYYVGLENRKTPNLINRKPIAIQIKDYSRMTLFEFMENNNIKNEDVLQVKTDSITFKKRNDKYLKYLNNEISGWKLEDYKKIVKCNKYNKPQLTLNYKNENILKLTNQLPYKSVSIIEGHAGNGKSHFIINDLIPKIVNDNESYRVLTPSHDSANEYRKNNLNVRVIQGYQFKGIIPKEKHIIIDEIGMVSSNDWSVIIKCILLEKYVYCFGDFDQLEPVKSGKVTKNFLNSLFDNHITFTENYRNNYSKKYYQNLIKSDNNNYLYDEVKKVSINEWSNDCLLVSYTNKTRHKYNKIICDKLNIPYILKNDKTLQISNNIKEGVPIICKSNVLSMLGIYNKFSFTIKKNNGKKIIINDGIKDYNLDYETIKNYFDYAYCRTLHSIQGKSIEKIKFCKEDIRFLSNNQAYTFISRLKENIDVTNKIKYKLI